MHSCVAFFTVGTNCMISGILVNISTLSGELEILRLSGYIKACIAKQRRYVHKLSITYDELTNAAHEIATSQPKNNPGSIKVVRAGSGLNRSVTKRLRGVIPKETGPFTLIGKRNLNLNPSDSRGVIVNRPFTGLLKIPGIGDIAKKRPGDGLSMAALNRIGLMHENFERSAILNGSKFLKGNGYYTHASPGVLLREHNLLTTLKKDPKGAGAVNTLVDLRNNFNKYTRREIESLERMVRSVTGKKMNYGNSQRLNRHAIRKIENAYGNELKPLLEKHLSSCMNVQQLHDVASRSIPVAKLNIAGRFIEKMRRKLLDRLMSR